MMRSLFSGVSGLRVHQTKMDVIANNISNVNTTGFKAGRVTFSEIFSQTVAGASGANPVTGRGGVNPMQVGLGANVASIGKIMTTGAAQRTDNPFDVMIQGDGFLIVGDASGTYFTRAGALDLDKEGNLVMAGSGMRVMGWDAVLDTNTTSPTYGQYIIQKGTTKPLTVGGDKQYVMPKPSTMYEFEGNLNADTTPERTSTMEIYDSVGTKYVVDVKYIYTPAVGTTPGYWKYQVGNLAYPEGDKTKAAVELKVAPGTATTPVTISVVGKSAFPLPDPIFADVATMEFDTNGKMVRATPAGGTAPAAGVTDFVINFKADTTNASVLAALVPGATFGKGANGEINLKFGKMTQTADTANPKVVRKDGNKRGALTGISIGSDGKIMGRYSNDELRLLGQIPVARFANPAGLEKVGDNLFVVTANSGDFDGVGEEVQSGGGKMMGGVLEMSNVDLSAEFTEMITTQRGFQANSRVISTSDDMLQELVNLKR